jgi:hypothetical protein
MMDDWQLNTPVALLIFNRPETTARVFAAIAQAKPPKLLVVADGPRADRPGEDAKCAATRAIIEQVDWDCEVVRNFADSNLGCRRRVSSGLDWVFSMAEQAIILEDDCVPHPSFFRYCDELLSRYGDDERVMMISGDNFQGGRRHREYSYYFSRYCHVWGWATWRRAWQYYDVDMRAWPLVRDGQWIEDLLGERRATTRWKSTFQAMYEGRVDTWDSQWMFTCWSQNGLSIMPHVNLVSNIGFHQEATHTVNSESRLANMHTEAMGFPLQHPPFIIRDAQADHFTEQIMFNPGLKSLFRLGVNKVLRKTKRLITSK